MTYIVMCKVSGGYTGTNIAPLKTSEKDKHGQRKIRYFDTRAEAETEAERLNKMPRSPHSLAAFRYWIEEC